MKIPTFIIAICSALALVTPIYLTHNFVNSEIVSVESFKSVYIGMASDTPIVSYGELDKHYLLAKDRFPLDFDFDSKNTIVTLEISKRKVPYFYKAIFKNDVFSLNSDFKVTVN